LALPVLSPAGADCAQAAPLAMSAIWATPIAIAVFLKFFNLLVPIYFSVWSP
jgi:hypothetical protein